VPAIFLDTTVLIDVMRGKSAAERLTRLRSAGVVPAICAVTVEELWRGIRRDEEHALTQIVRGLRVVPLLAPEGERAGRWRRDFALRGVTLGQADCLIAAAAVTIGAPLATANVADFPMPELTVEDWT
jgi:predicted nucleic acid-binding protein